MDYRKCPNCEQVSLNHKGICIRIECPSNQLGKTSKEGVPIVRRPVGSNPGFQAVRPERQRTATPSVLIQAVRGERMLPLPKTPDLSDVEGSPPKADNLPPTARRPRSAQAAAPPADTDEMPPSRRMTVMAPERALTTQPAPPTFTTIPDDLGEPTESDGLRERITEEPPLDGEDEVTSWDKDTTPAETPVVLRQSSQPASDGTMPPQPRRQPRQEYILPKRLEPKSRSESGITLRDDAFPEQEAGSGTHGSKP